MDEKKIVVVVIGLLLVAVMPSVVFGVKDDGQKKLKDYSNQSSESSDAIAILCQSTDYKETCVNSLKAAAGNISDPKELIKIEFKVTVDALKEAMRNSSTLKELANDSRTSQALKNCDQLLNSSIDDLEKSFDKMGEFNMSTLDDYVHEIKILLSGAITFEESCLDEFENITNSEVGEKMKEILQSSRELTSNGLAMVSGISSVNQKQLYTKYYSEQNNESGYPSWVSSETRKPQIEADFINYFSVGKNNTGTYETISEALENVPKDNNDIFTIYITVGVYEETVTVTRDNIWFLGDGPEYTKIIGNKNYADGIQTIGTATVTVLGDNFYARDIGFENSAGAIKQQAVALRVQSNKSIFYRCHIDGYQNTLYVHAHAQFYRDCTISGTIDFIFGDAAAVFQNCTMVVRKPLENQNCTVTAQGRSNLRSTTGIVVQNCTITGDTTYLPFKNTNKAYLGSPWKEYSRTVIMQSHIDDIIQPEGWLPRQGTFALDTCWYAEYENRGLGSAQTGRVTWEGIKKINASQANSFTLAQFIKDDWIEPVDDVPHDSGFDENLE